MTALTINLPDDRMLTLQERAEELGVTPEELVRVSIEELLSRPEDDFQHALSYVLRKNADLYKRLD
jgi:predicted transcriptional regulator